MKRTTILFVLLFAVTCVFAQKGKVTSALSFKETGKLDKAVASIEEAIDASNPKTEGSISWPRTWEVRGEIYQAVFQTKDENFKKLNSDPLTVAYESYMKALTLDDKEKFSKSVKIKLTLLISDLTNQAVAAFNEENYEKALKSFEQVIGIEQTPVFKADDPTAVDTVIIFNAGLAAFNAQNYDKAIQYYKEAAKYKYSGARTYQLISSSYLLKKDTLGALNALQEGLREYPSNGTILVEVINIYLNANKVDEALKYLDIAIQQDPKNASYYFAKGTLYDKLQNQKIVDIGITKEKVIEILGKPNKISKTTTSGSNDELMLYDSYSINIDKDGKVNYVNQVTDYSEDAVNCYLKAIEYSNSNDLIVVGMTKSKVIEILGNPKSGSKTTTSGSNDELLFYEGGEINIDKDGKVTYIRETENGINKKGGFNGFDAYYNLGALYYNKGVKQIDVANAIPSNQPEKYEEEKNKADLEFKKAIPYMEKAHEVNPTDKFTMESLKTLYYRLKMLDKHAEIVEKMKNL